MKLPTVTCSICGQRMVYQRQVANVVHHYEDHARLKQTVTPMLLYLCKTADCDNQVVVEGT